MKQTRIMLCCVLLCVVAHAETVVFKSEDQEGNVSFSDRVPADHATTETVHLLDNSDNEEWDSASVLSKKIHIPSKGDRYHPVVPSCPSKGRTPDSAPTPGLVVDEERIALMNEIKGSKKKLEAMRTELRRLEHSWQLAQHEYSNTPSINHHDEEVRRQRLRILADNLKWEHKRMHDAETRIAAIRNRLVRRHLGFG